MSASWPDGRWVRGGADPGRLEDEPGGGPRGLPGGVFPAFLLLPGAHSLCTWAPLVLGSQSCPLSTFLGHSYFFVLTSAWF